MGKVSRKHAVQKSRSYQAKRASFYQSKTVSYYLQTYLLMLFVGVVVFAGGKMLIKPRLACANSKSCLSDRTEKIENGAVGTFEGHTVIPPQIDLNEGNTQSVLGDNTPSGEKHIYVDLSQQKLYAYQGDSEVMETLISSGKWNNTPVGNFHIWIKLRATRMSGGEGADAYDLPNVPYVMYFYQDFGLHGAYWHDNFGHMMSHGCVNMRQIDAKALYEWADGPTNDHPGTEVSVCNSFTKPNVCQQDNPIQ